MLPRQILAEQQVVVTIEYGEERERVAYDLVVVAIASTLTGSESCSAATPGTCSKALAPGEITGRERRGLRRSLP